MSTTIRLAKMTGSLSRQATITEKEGDGPDLPGLGDSWLPGRVPPVPPQYGYKAQLFYLAGQRYSEIALHREVLASNSRRL